MKKLCMITLALCLLLSLAACSTEGKAPDAKDTTAAAQTTVQTPSDTDAPETDAPETEAPETDAPVPVTTAAPAPDTTAAPQTGLNHGVIEGNAYLNETLNLRIACPEGFSFYTEEQLAAQNSLTADLLEQTDISDLVKQNGQLIDMCMSTASGSSANLVISPNNASLKSVTDEQLISMMKDMLVEQYEKVGMHVVEAEAKTMQLFGSDKPVLVLDIEVNDTPIRMYQFFDREASDDYYATNTITLSTDTGTIHPPSTLYGGRW